MADVASLHQEMFECIQRRDFDRLRALYHPEYRYESADGTSGGVEEGLAMAKTYTTAFPDLAFTVRSEFSSGSKSVMELTAKGTHKEELEGIPATGKTVAIPVCNVLEERDGLIIRECDYFDNYSFLKQLGVVE
jgi:steroid delta-isomerase-like uncharacterized protein